MTVNRHVYLKNRLNFLNHALFRSKYLQVIFIKTN